MTIPAHLLDGLAEDMDNVDSLTKRVEIIAMLSWKLGHENTVADIRRQFEGAMKIYEKRLAMTDEYDVEDLLPGSEVIVALALEGTENAFEKASEEDRPARLIEVADGLLTGLLAVLAFNEMLAQKAKAGEEA